MGMFGKLIEQELLGEVKKDPATYERLVDMETVYQGYKQSIMYVKEHQRGDPAHPARFFPRSLLERLRTNPELNINSDEQIRFYTAVGSSLDRFHGVDAFFEYNTSDGKSVRVTIDVTINPNKDRYKADVVLAIPQEGLDPKDQNYNELISQFAELVKEEILTKVTN